MKIKVYAFRIGIALLAFSFGVVNFYEFRFVQSYLDSEKCNPFSINAIPLIQANISNINKEIPADLDEIVEYYTDEDALGKDFKTFRNIEIETPDYKKASTEKPDEKAMFAKGAINFAMQYRFNHITISEKDIAFETEEVNGTRYRFRGYFFKNKALAPDLSLYLSIHGHLTRLKNGGKTAETEIELSPVIIRDGITRVILEAAIGIEPMNKAFAELCLTTWLRRRV